MSTRQSRLSVLPLILILSTVISLVRCHGYMKQPAARNWLQQYMKANSCSAPNKVVPNYDFRSLNCGGLAYQTGTAKGKCGACGDKFPAKSREHENGKYASKNVVQAYYAGCYMDVTIALTAAHKGWFEFRLCHDPFGSENDVDSVKYKTPLDACFGVSSRHRLLEIKGGGTRAGGIQSQPAIFSYQLKIPDDIRCTHCVLQWKYHGGNNWGNDQEEFVNCADISVIDSVNDLPTELMTCNDKPNVAARCPEASTGSAGSPAKPGSGSASPFDAMICDLMRGHTNMQKMYKKCCHKTCSGGNATQCNTYKLNCKN